MIQCHELGKPLEALHVTREFIITGGKDCKINFFDTKGNYKILLVVKVPETVKGALMPEVKSV